MSFVSGFGLVVYILYLVSHEGSNVAGLPSWSSTHIQDPLSRAGPEHVSHNNRWKVLQGVTSLTSNYRIMQEICLLLWSYGLIDLLVILSG